MKRILLSLLVVFCGNNICIYSQKTSISSIIPPSPETASLAKFTEIPVNLYTGLPNIAIPLYSFDTDGLKLNIGLSYHGRGVSVSEIASRVGTGWALNAGGAITRQTRGKPDDGNDGYINKNFLNNFFTDSNVRLSVYNGILEDRIDIEPDRFSFNFLGFSGKFYFDQRDSKKQIVMEEYSDLKIEPIFETGYYRILGWIITDPDGYKYYFGLPRDPSQSSRIARDNDTSQNYRANLRNYTALRADPPSVYNAWQLIDIVSPRGKTVNFNYNAETTNFCRKTYDTEEDNGSGGRELVSYYSMVSSSQSELKQIDFDEGNIKFISYPETRKDLESSHALQYVQVTDKMGGVVKRYKFDYSYSHNNSSANVLPLFSIADTTSAYRLFLDSVTEVSESEKLPPYSFTYIDKNATPNRLTTSIDHWGFYNGKDNGYFSNYDNATENADDKTVDPEKAKVGLLSSIKYPTGGYVNYEFEPNQASPPEYYDQLIFNDTNPIQSRSVGLFKNYKQQVASGLYESKEFNVAHAVPGYIVTDFSIWGSDMFYAQIVNSNDLVIQNTPLGTNKQILLNLPPGIYKIRVTSQDNDDPYDLTSSFNVTIKWNEYVASQPKSQLIYSGGNRIKKITLSSAGGSTVEKEYSYIDNNGLSSGRVYSLPCYNFIRTTIPAGTQLKGILTPGCPLTYNQGNHIGYSCVTENLTSNNGQSGKTRYFYTCMYDDGDFWKFPYTIPDDNEDLRGKLVRTDYFKTDEKTKLDKLIKRIDYGYTAFGAKTYTYNNMYDLPSNDTTYLINKLKFCLPLIIFTGDVPNELDYLYKTYYMRGGTMQLSYIQAQEYLGELLEDTDSKNFILSGEKYTYDNLNNYQMIQKEITSSNEKVITTRYYHPSDYGGYFRELKEKNIIIPIDTRTYCENKLISGQQIKFNENGQPLATYKAEPATEDIFFNAASPFTFSPDLFYSYDSISKNLQTSVARDNITKVYLWSYNGQYPIAEIKNATFSDVEPVVRSLFGVSKLDDLSAMSVPLEVKLTDGSLQRALPSAQVTTYTYRPLVGMTSATAPNGVTTYYEYDTFNRLKRTYIIENGQQKTVQSYDYHYKQ